MSRVVSRLSCVYSILRSHSLPKKSLYAGAAEVKMALPEDLGDCAQDGDQDRVFAYDREPHD